jgi:hypothetical protein
MGKRPAPVPDRHALDGVSVLQGWPSVKRKPRGDAGHCGGGAKWDTLAVGTATVQMGGYWTRAEWLVVTSRFAKLRKSLRVMTLWRLYAYETLLEGLAQHLQDMAAKLRQFIQPEHAMMCQRQLARQRHLAALDQPRIRDGAVGSVIQCRRLSRLIRS